MKLPQKRTLVKKPKQPKRPNMDSLSDEPLGPITIDLGDINVSGSSHIGGGTGIDTITISPQNYYSGSITVPNTYITDSTYLGVGGGGTGYNWTTTTTNIPTVNIDTNGVNIKEGGDIKIGNKSLSDAIEKIEERLGILNPNPALEDRWDKLKELRKQYMELEKDLLEKEKIMEILKKE
jgi:hypothetical protein